MTCETSEGNYRAADCLDRRERRSPEPPDASGLPRASKDCQAVRRDHTLESAALVSEACKRRYSKGGSDQARVLLEVTVLGTRARGVEVLALDDALASLAKLDLRIGRVVELRFFGGFSLEETAEFLRISPETVLLDWKMAKVSLSRELSTTGTTVHR
jgi:DNA-directed RNA polymerase specialized sigma24 family protein